MKIENKERTQCDRAAMKKHLMRVAVLDQSTNERMATVQILPSREDRSIKAKWFHIAINDKTVEKLAAASEAGASIAVVPQKTDGRGRKKENILNVRYLFVDIDDPTTLKKLKRLKVQPDIIVKTSPGRYHLYFRTRCKRAEFSVHEKALAKFLHGDPAATDLARVLRVAGTINWKQEEPFVSKLVGCRINRTPLTAAALLSAFGITAAAPKIVDEEPVSGTIAPHQEISRNEIEKLLAVIPAHDRDVWLHVGMALHSLKEPDGFTLWDEWSKTASEKYQREQQKSTWDGFDAGKGRTIGTLYYYAKSFGVGVTTEKNQSWIPMSEGDIAVYAACVLKDKLKIADNHHYVFHNHRWHRDTKAAARLMLDVINELYASAKSAGALSAKKALQRIKNYGAAHRLLTALHACPDLDVKSEEFDVNPYLLGLPNGVIDLRTGVFRDGHPEDMITVSTKAEYDAGAKCPRFENFLVDIAPSNDYRAYIQQLLGYLLVGHGLEQKGFILLGKGSNGKGTLTRALQAVLGDTYSTTLSPAFIKGASRGNANGPTPALMPLRKARAIFCTESDRKKGVDETFFKQLTGNDTLSGRHNYGEQESFMTPGKLILSTNVMPDWSYSEDALWRRVVVLPFKKQFKEGQGRRNDLDAELAEEQSGILNFMIDGARRYLAQRGLSECQEVSKATARARNRSDTVRMWRFAECKKSASSSLPVKEAYDSYAAFAYRKGLDSVPLIRFGQQMEALGFRRHRESRGRVFLGVKRADS